MGDRNPAGPKLAPQGLGTLSPASLAPGFHTILHLRLERSLYPANRALCLRSLTLRSTHLFSSAATEGTRINGSMTSQS